MTPKPQHLAVYLGNNQYQCAKCGLVNSRLEVSQGWSKPCVVTEITDLARMLDTFEGKMNEIEAATLKALEDLAAEITILKGVPK